MVNEQCYLDVLTGLWECVHKKRPELWPDKWILHFYDACAHDALRRRPSSGMLRRVALVGTDFSEEHIASIIRMTGIGKTSQKTVFFSHRCENLKSYRVHEFLAKKSITIMDRLHYSPGLAPCNFCLFPN
jgi:hypothetical protein